MKRRIAGIVLVALSVGALGFWELWGRENITYDKVLVLKDGETVEYGETQQVLSRPQADYTRQLLSAVPRLRRA